VAGQKCRDSGLALLGAGRRSAATSQIGSRTECILPEAGRDGFLAGIAFVRRPSAAKAPPECRSPPAGPPHTPIEIIVGGGTNAFGVAGDFSCVSGASVDKWR
jgi:hypothetical protein